MKKVYEGVAAVCICLFPALLQRRILKMTAETWDVIIVGAGLSGLSAAHFLLKRNTSLKILVLEAKGRHLIPLSNFLSNV